MTVLPIVARELRVSARRWGTYILRLGAATSAIALAVIVYFFASQQGARPADLGRIIFVVLSGFAFLYALLIGVRVTSDCLSSEKREGTLGLLFLTDLKGYDIVLGKLAASALDSFYALLGILPVLAIPILLGSVTAGEIRRTAVALVSTALFSICAGLMVSALSVHERKATAGTFLLILLITAGLPVVILITQAYTGWGADVLWAFGLSPGASIVAALANTPASIPFDLYWFSIGMSLIYAVIFTAVATFAVPRVWKQKAEPLRKPVREPDAQRQDVAQRWRQRAAVLDASPSCWLAGRGRLRGLWLWIFLACALGSWLWGYAEGGSSMLNSELNLFWLFLVQGVIKVFIASEAVRTYSEEFKRGALELILCAPLRVREIINGQLLNLFRYFRWPVAALLGLDFFLLLLSGWKADEAFFGQMWVLTTVLFVIDCVAIGVVGLWQGLIGRNSRHALTGTMVRILVLPWILFGLTNLVLTNFLGSNIKESVELLLWAGIGLAVDGFFAWNAWDRLHQDLRTVAASRYGGSHTSPWWSRLGRIYRRRKNRRPTG